MSGTYCFKTIPANLDTTPTPGQCGEDLGDYIPMAGTNFLREVTVSVGGAPEYSMLVTTTVSWIDGTETRQVELIQEFENTN